MGTHPLSYLDTFNQRLGDAETRRGGGELIGQLWKGAFALPEVDTDSSQPWPMVPWVSP